jgi:tetratricopeptide (TPR) repeat protein
MLIVAQFGGPSAAMRDITRALWAGESPERLVPDLVRLACASEPATAAWCFAHRTLAVTVAPSDPWRASLLARRLLAVEPDDHAAWAALGLAQSILGNHRFAVRCYERALGISPAQPRYAHNLGHLYDVALGRPHDAIPLLADAHAAEPRCADIAASYAHALGRAGRVREGLALLRRVLAAARGGGGATRDQAEVVAWLEAELSSRSRPGRPRRPSISGGARAERSVRARRRPRS